MAVVILGGLITSTLLNLFVVPSLYLRFGKSRGTEPGEPLRPPRCPHEPARRLAMRSTARIVAVVTLGTLGLAACAGRGTSAPQSPSAAQSLPPVVSAADFDPATFTHPTEVTNPWFPLVPGTRFTWQGPCDRRGRAREPQGGVHRHRPHEGGERGPHGRHVRQRLQRRRTRGGRARRSSPRTTTATSGTWASTPRSSTATKIVKTPTWIAGLHGARAGIHMPAVPRLGTPSYAMGWGGSDVHWNDRGQVDQLGQADLRPARRATRASS